MVLEKAHELGKALSSSEEFTRMVELRAQMEKDEALRLQVNEFIITQRELMDMMNAEDADPDRMRELSNDLERIQGDLQANELFSAVMEAQHDFERLVKEMNAIIGEYVGMGDDHDHDCGGCEGDCSHDCEGCRH